MKVSFRVFLLSILGFLTLGNVAFAQTTVSVTPGVQAPGTSASGVFFTPVTAISGPVTTTSGLETKPAHGDQPLATDATLGYFDLTLPTVTSGIQQLGSYTVYAYGERMTLATNSGYVDTVHLTFASMTGDSVLLELIADTLFPTPSTPGAFHLINAWATAKVYAAQWIPVPQTSGEFTLNWALPHVAVPKNFFVLVQADVNQQLQQITSAFGLVGSRKQIAPRTPSGSRSAFLAFVNGQPTTSLFDTVFVDGQGQPIYADFDLTVVGPASQVQPAILAFTPSPLDFDTVSLGSTNTMTAVLKNTGEENATITTADVTGNSDFSLNPPTLPEVIGTGDTLGFDLSYAPTSSGNASATLTLTFSDNTTKTVTLQGAGSAPSSTLSLSSSSHDFGNVVLGSTPSSFGFKLTNNSASDVTITDVSISPAGTDFTAPFPLPGFLLKAGKSTTVSAGFAPTSEGLQIATVTLTMDDGTTLQIKLSGTGVASGVSPLAQLDQALTIFPNPAVSSFQIKSGVAVSSVELLDLLGRTVLSQKLSAGGTLDVSRLEPGRYEAVVHTEKGIVSAPVLIQH